MNENHAAPTRGALGIQERAEIALRIPNDLNVLARLFNVLGSQQRSVLAWCFYSDHERATFLLVTGNDDNKSPRVLRAAGFECEVRPVIVVAQRFHQLSATQLSGELRAAGVESLDMYTCCSPDYGPLLVLRTSDTSRVVAVLEAVESQKQISSIRRQSDAALEPVEAVV